MENSYLKEHRCACGKLLCRGILFTTVIELKCRFCHRVNRFYGVDGQVQPRIMRYTLLLDILSGIRITDISPSASDILGYSRSELLSLNTSVAANGGLQRAEGGQTYFSLSADLDGTCVYVTPGIEQVLGYTQAEMLGNFIFDYFAPEDREKHRALYLSSIKINSPFRSTVRFSVLIVVYLIQVIYKHRIPRGSRSPYPFWRTGFSF